MVFLSKRALRQLKRLPRDIVGRLRARLRVLKGDPFQSRSGADISMVWGHDDPPLYRLLVGGYRVLYFVLEEEVRITEILHRSRAFRGLD